VSLLKDILSTAALPAKFSYHLALQTISHQWQIYIGQQQKGVLFIVIGICLVLMIYVLIGIVLYPLFWLYSTFRAEVFFRKLGEECA
jgi:hypothetical protein